MLMERPMNTVVFVVIDCSCRGRMRWSSKDLKLKRDILPSYLMKGAVV